MALLAGLIGLEPVAALAFAVGRIATLIVAEMDIQEGQYLSAGIGIVFAALPGPDTEVLEAGAAVEG